MPLRGETHSDLVRDETPYLKYITELDLWFTRAHEKLSGVLPYQPRPHTEDSAKLLVCHDYRGGYTETPSGLCYTFNFWPLCDTFVYFSHHRVTVPPSGWTNAAHRHGTKMLGTLIFEGDSDSECIQLIVGRANYKIKDNRIPISKRYAVFLAELAYQRGFDGYLLNFETDLSSETNHARALAAWILLLRAELRAKVGPHSQVMWYDSVIYDGWVQYQNRLDGYNLPFYLASDTLFTNYWWLPETQHSMTQYFKQLDPSPSATIKSLQSIYSGVDVWGRGQYGDGGYSCYRSITHTAPLGFSTALFGPAWTWESKTDHPELYWEYWWANERRLWLGPLKPGEFIPVDISPEGPFKPMTAFFQTLPLPTPSSSVFYTSFSPGVGYSWFVEGEKVLDTKVGWTDIDKQGSIGDLVWPWPTPSWHGVERLEPPPTGTTAIDMTDGYNGGNTLKLTLEYTASYPDDTVNSIWIPIQSLTVTTRETFEARIVYKSTADDNVNIDAHLVVKSQSYDVIASAGFTVDQAIVSHLPRGWTRQTIHFVSASTRDTASVVVIGFVVDFKPKVTSTVTFSFSLGQLAMYPTPPSPPVSVGTPSVTDAAFAPIHQPDPHTADPLQGVLTWDTTSTLEPIDIQIDSPDVTTPAWHLQDTLAYRFPTFVYFNVYAAPLCGSVSDAVFIGTTGLDGRGNRFYTEQACFPDGWDRLLGVRLFVQGVTDHGDVLPWERCATVDHVQHQQTEEV